MGKAAEGALIIFVGDKLGLFKAMAGAGELTPEELANCSLGCNWSHILAHYLKTEISKKEMHKVEVIIIW